MINLLLLICSTIVIYEFIKYVQLIKIIQLNLKIYKKILKLFKYKKASDFRKEKLILDYSKSLLVVSIKIVATLTSISIFMVILNLLSNSYLNSVISILGIIKITVVFIIYHLIRKTFYA